MCGPSIGPIADLHTHLALRTGHVEDSPSVGFPKLAPRDAALLAFVLALDLEVCANRNMSPGIVAELTRGLTLEAWVRAECVCCTVPNFVREMDEAGILPPAAPHRLPAPLDNTNISVAGGDDDAEDVLVRVGVPYSLDLEESSMRNTSAGARGHQGKIIGAARPGGQQARTQLLQDVAVVARWWCCWLTAVPAGIEAEVGAVH